MSEQHSARQRDERSPADPGPIAASMLGLTGFCLFYVGAKLLAIPLPHYLPLEARFVLSVSEGKVSMGYYAMIGFGLIGMLVGIIVGSLPPIRRWAEQDRSRSMLGLLTLGTLVLALGYYLVVELWL
ncbi:MAG: hypothetical protein H6707_14530 [Deltaproteobacteria bacterium]|nr:hypothetical protein [Deltaproteobacteria bacterium]